MAMACPLCGRTGENLSYSGMKECFGDDASHEDKSCLSIDMCWWCFYRFHAWFDRKYTYSTTVAPTVEHIVEFTIGLMRTKPKWLGNPDAYHTKMPTDHPIRRERTRVLKESYRLNRIRIRHERAVALMAMEKPHRVVHRMLDERNGMTYDTDYTPEKLAEIIAIPGVHMCDCKDVSVCHSDGAGRCIISNSLNLL